MTLPGAWLPFQPIPNPLPVPDAPYGTGSYVCVQIDSNWMPYILGLCRTLLAASSWATASHTIMDDVRQDVQRLLSDLASYEACPMPIQFRVNPSDSRRWQYSNDGGVNWIDQPSVDFSPSDTPTSALENIITSNDAAIIPLRAVTTVGASAISLVKGAFEFPSTRQEAIANFNKKVEDITDILTTILLTS